MMAYLLAFLLFSGPPETVEKVTLELELPSLDVRPYHRPYVAIWLETTGRDGVQTIAVWHEGDKWLKDLRQWWRKLGRDSQPPYDGMSGATRKPGTYTINWDVKDKEGNPLPHGEYSLNIEAVREEGGRDFLKQKLLMGAGKSQHFTLAGEGELGKIEIKIN